MIIYIGSPEIHSSIIYDRYMKYIAQINGWLTVYDKEELFF